MSSTSARSGACGRQSPARSRNARIGAGCDRDVAGAYRHPRRCSRSWWRLSARGGRPAPFALRCTVPRRRPPCRHSSPDPPGSLPLPLIVLRKDLCPPMLTVRCGGICNRLSIKALGFLMSQWVMVGTPERKNFQLLAAGGLSFCPSPTFLAPRKESFCPGAESLGWGVTQAYFTSNF